MLGGGIFFLPFGLAPWSYLIWGFFHDVQHGNVYLEEWLVVVDGIWKLVCPLTGFCIVKRYRSAFTLSIIATIYTYAQSTVWFSIGNWALHRLSDRGSAQGSLRFGETLIRPGDYESVYIDPRVWLLKMLLLTAVFAILLFLLIKYWPRMNQQSMHSFPRGSSPLRNGEG